MVTWRLISLTDRLCTVARVVIREWEAIRAQLSFQGPSAALKDDHAQNSMKGIYLP
jgi:hypothetical protein